MLSPIQSKSFYSLVVFIVLTLNISYLSSQEVGIQWYNSQSENPKGFNNDFKILKANNNEIIYLCQPGLDFPFVPVSLPIEKPRYYIVNHNLKNGSNKTCELLFEHGDNKLRKLNVIQLHDDVAVFSYYLDSKTKLLHLFCETYDLEVVQSNNDLKEISEIDLSILKEMDLKLRDSELFFDKGRFLFRFECKSREGDFFGFEVFDLNLNKVWESSILPFVGGNYIQELGIQLDYDGNVYAVNRVFDNKKEARNGDLETGEIKVVHYTKNAKEPNVLPLKLKNNGLVKSLQFTVNELNELVIAGLYTKAGSDRIVGYFSYILDAMCSSVKAEFQKDFSPEFNAKGTDERESFAGLQKADIKSNYDYLPDSIYFRKDGGFDVVFQKFIHIITTYRNSQGGVYIEHKRVFGDNFVLSFNNDGSPRWQQKIGKYNLTLNREYHIGDYFSRYDEDENMQFLFNLNNLTGTNSKNVKDTKTIFIQLDKDGNETFKLIEKDGREAHQICVRDAFVKNDSTIVLYKYPINFDKTVFLGKKNNYLQFGELKLK